MERDRESWVAGCGYKSNRMDPCNDGTILYLDCGDGYMGLHVIKLYRINIHTHTHT